MLTQKDTQQIKKWIDSCQGPEQLQLVIDFVENMFDGGKLTKELYKELTLSLDAKIKDLQIMLNKVRQQYTAGCVNPDLTIRVYEPANDI